MQNIQLPNLRYRIVLTMAISLHFMACQSTVQQSPGYHEAGQLFQKLYQPGQSAHQDRVLEKKIQELAPQSEFALYIKADQLYSHGAYGEALALLKKALDLNSNEAQFYNLAGLSARRLQMLDQARSYFEDGLDLNEDNQNLLINRGNLALQQEEYQEAIAFFQQAVRKNPDSAAAFNGLAFSHFNLGQYDQARKACQKSRQLDQDDTSAIWLEAALLKKSGDDKKARSKFQQCCRMGDGECCRDLKQDYPAHPEQSRAKLKPASLIFSMQTFVKVAGR